MFHAWEANPDQRSSSVWVDRSREYGTPLDPWSKVHGTDEGILQSMMIEGAPWNDHHHRSLFRNMKKILKVTFITLQFLNS